VLVMYRLSGRERHVGGFDLIYDDGPIYMDTSHEVAAIATAASTTTAGSTTSTGSTATSTNVTSSLANLNSFLGLLRSSNLYYNNWTV